MADTKELRRLAQAATPGPWEVYGLDQNGQAIIRGEHIEIATCWHHCVGSIEKEMHANAAFIAAANPAVIDELIDRLEAAEKSDAESIAMYRKARDERDALHTDLLKQQALTESALALAEVTQRRADKLQAKVEAMEQQEPVATVRINAINGNPSVDFVPGHRYLHHNDKLYLAHGAQPVQHIAEVAQSRANQLQAKIAEMENKS